LSAFSIRYAKHPQEPLQLLATDVLLVKVEVEEAWLERLCARLVLGIVIRLEVRVAEALLDRVASARVD